MLILCIDDFQIYIPTLTSFFNSRPIFLSTRYLHLNNLQIFKTQHVVFFFKSICLTFSVLVNDVPSPQSPRLGSLESSKIFTSFLFPYPFHQSPRSVDSHNTYHIDHRWPDLPHTHLYSLGDLRAETVSAWLWILSSYRWTWYVAHWLLCKCFYVADSPGHTHIHNNQLISGSYKEFWEKNILWCICFSQQKNIWYIYICIMDY